MNEEKRKQKNDKEEKIRESKISTGTCRGTKTSRRKRLKSSRRKKRRGRRIWSWTRREALEEEEGDIRAGGAGKEEGVKTFRTSAA